MTRSNSGISTITRGIIYFLVLTGVAAIAIQKLDERILEEKGNLNHKATEIANEIPSPSLLKRAQPANSFAVNPSENFKPPLPPKPNAWKNPTKINEKPNIESQKPKLPPKPKRKFDHYQNWDVPNQKFQAPETFENLAVKKELKKELEKSKRNSFSANFQTRYPTLGDVWSEIFPLDKRMFQPTPVELVEIAAPALETETTEVHKTEELGTTMEFSEYASTIKTDTASTIKTDTASTIKTDTASTIKTDTQTKNQDRNSFNSRYSYSDYEDSDTPPRELPESIIFKGRTALRPWVQLEEQLRINAEVHKAEEQNAQPVERKTGFSGGFFTNQAEIEKEKVKEKERKNQMQDQNQEKEAGEEQEPESEPGKEGDQEPEQDKGQSSQKQQPGYSSANFVMLDVAAMVKTVENGFTDKRQTAVWAATSRMDASAAVGVADALSGKERTINETSQMPQELCNKAKGMFEFLKSKIGASGLLDKAYREVLKKEEKVKGCAAAVFGIISRDGKATISVIKNAGAALYRENRLVNITEIRDHTYGEPYITVPDDIIQTAGSLETKQRFDVFADKPEYEWETQPGDVFLFYSADARKFTKPADFPALLKANPDDSAQELVEKFSDFVVGKISTKQKKCEADQLFNCFPCFRGKTEEFPTDVGLAVVKVS